VCTPQTVIVVHGVTIAGQKHLYKTPLITCFIVIAINHWSYLYRNYRNIRKLYVFITETNCVYIATLQYTVKGSETRLMYMFIATVAYTETI